MAVLQRSRCSWMMHRSVVLHRSLVLVATLSCCGGRRSAFAVVVVVFVRVRTYTEVDVSLWGLGETLEVHNCPCVRAIRGYLRERSRYNLVIAFLEFTGIW